MNNNNDDISFEDAVARFGPLITKICYYYSVDRSQFDDLRQECFINIWKGMKQFRRDAKLSTWIYRVCLNSCVSYMRRRPRGERLSIDNIADIGESDNFTTSDYNEMHRLIGTLPPADKAVILLWLDEKSYEEIAEITGLKRNTVAVRINRIKERLIKMSNQ